MNLETQSIVITGLPGSGKTRVMAALHRQFGCERLTQEESFSSEFTTKLTRPGCFETSDLASLPRFAESHQIWCVIDVRSPLVAGRDDWVSDYLKSCVAYASGLVFSFLESASLDDQAWWNKWVSQNAKDVPLVRWLNQAFPANWRGFPDRVAPAPLSRDCAFVQSLQSFYFTVGRVSLDHLLFGLDSSKQNLGMKIARVTGVLATREYENKIAIEGSATRWDVYAADGAVEAGCLVIQGVGLDETWLDQLVKASELA